MQYSEMVVALESCNWKDFCGVFSKWLAENNCPSTLRQMSGDYLATLPPDAPTDYLRGMLVVHMGRVYTYMGEAVDDKGETYASKFGLTPEQDRAVKVRDLMDALMSMAATAALTSRLGLWVEGEENPFDAFLSIEVPGE